MRLVSCMEKLGSFVGIVIDNCLLLMIIIEG